jgi:hypothetical protein
MFVFVFRKFSVGAAREVQVCAVLPLAPPGCMTETQHMRRHWHFDCGINIHCMSLDPIISPRKHQKLNAKALSVVYANAVGTHSC